MEEKIRNLTFIVLFGFVITFMLIIGLYFRTNDNNSVVKSSSSSSTDTSETDYDVSNMNKVSVADAIDLFDEKGVHVLYIGRSTCSVCVGFVPILNEVAAELDFTPNYLEVEVSTDKSWSDWQKDLKDLTDLLDIEASANGEEGTLGELFYNNGFTPAFVVIKDGKVVEGFFGSRDSETLISLLEDYFN